jgi:hypothetical protein
MSSLTDICLYGISWFWKQGFSAVVLIGNIVITWSSLMKKTPPFLEEFVFIYDSIFFLS